MQCKERRLIDPGRVPVVTSRPPQRRIRIYACSGAATRTSQLPPLPLAARAISGDERPDPYPIESPRFRRATRPPTDAQAPAAARRARPAPTHHHACMAPSRHYHASSRPAGGRPDVVAAHARASGAPQAAAGRSCPAVPAGPDRRPPPSLSDSTWPGARAAWHWHWQHSAGRRRAPTRRLSHWYSRRRRFSCWVACDGNMQVQAGRFSFAR
jgi:hypothetical protein